jgi:hypothetical protein
MRLNSQNNQFIFLLPSDFIDKEMYDRLQKIIDNLHMPYDNILDYINSTIKEITFPSLSFDTKEMTKKYGKKIEYKEAGNVFDKFQNELDITFKSVDSHMNYFMMVQILIEYYMNNREQYLPYISLQVIDIFGNLIYTILFKDIIFKSLSELRMSYNVQEADEKTFSITFRYNWLDIIWELKDEHKNESISIFDIAYEKGNKDYQPEYPDIKDRNKK